MNRRSFFTKFTAMAAGFCALPKAVAGLKCTSVGSPVPPCDTLTEAYLDQHAETLTASTGAGLQAYFTPYKP